MSAVGLVAALTLWVGSSADDQVVAPASGEANAQARLPSTGLPPSLDRPMQATTASPVAASPAMMSALPSTTTGSMVPITVVAPQKLLVGETNNLTVSVGANAGFSEVGFTVQFDPDVLQVRGGTQGGWAVAVGFNPRFTAEISAAEDRVHIRSVMSDTGTGLQGGNVATVQFQAISTGTTSVLISDVVIKDSRGRSMVSAVSASNLQVTVDSVPQPTPAGQREHGAVAAEPPPETTEDGD